MQSFRYLELKLKQINIFGQLVITVQDFTSGIIGSDCVISTLLIVLKRNKNTFLFVLIGSRLAETSMRSLGLVLRFYSHLISASLG